MGREAKATRKKEILTKQKRNTDEKDGNIKQH